MTFCIVPIFGDQPKAVDECVRWLNDSRADVKKKDRKIDEMQDEIDELKREYGQVKGGRR